MKQANQLWIESTILFLIILVSLVVYVQKQRIIASLLRNLNKIKEEIEEKEHQLVRYRQEMVDLSQRQSDYADLQQSKQRVETEMKKLAQEVGKLKEQKAQILIRLSLKEEEMKRMEDQLEQVKNTPDIFVRIAETKRIEETEWPELIAKMDATYQQFTKRLQTAFPKLQKMDIRYCILWKLGYTKKFIIELMNTSEDNYFKRLQRIKARIDDSKKWEKGELEQFMQNF